jgi:hypothetical protein
MTLTIQGIGNGSINVNSGFGARPERKVIENRTNEQPRPTASSAPMTQDGIHVLNDIAKATQQVSHAARNNPLGMSLLILSLLLKGVSASDDSDSSEPFIVGPAYPRMEEGEKVIIDPALYVFFGALGGVMLCIFPCICLMARICDGKEPRTIRTNNSGAEMQEIPVTGPSTQEV